MIGLTICFQISLKGNIMLTALYGLYLEATPLMLGCIVAIGSLCPMFFASLAGRLTDRLPLQKLLSFSMIGAACSMLLPFLAHSLMALIVMQFFFGFFQIIAVVSSQNLVGKWSTAANRTKNYGTYTLGVSIANFIGPMSVGLAIDSIHFQWTYFALSFFAFVPGIIFSRIKLPVTSMRTETSKANQKNPSLLKDHSLRKVFITSGIILTGVGLFEFYFPIYTNTLQLSATTVGFLVSLHAIAFIISRLFMGPLQRKWHAEQILCGCLLLASGMFFLLPFSSSILSLSIIAFLLGLGLGCCQPLSIVMAYNYAPKKRSGEVLGIRLTINKAVQFSVPLIFGSISFIGFFSIFWFNTVLLFFGSLYLYNNVKKPTLHH